MIWDLGLHDKSNMQQSLRMHLKGKVVSTLTPIHSQTQHTLQIDIVFVSYAQYIITFVGFDSLDKVAFGVFKVKLNP